jgi:hypothetical protein
MKWTSFRKRSYVYITAMIFLVTVALHWIFSWEAYKNEQRGKGLQPQRQEYVIQTLRDTMENWQSEFLQLIWQVAGLSFLYFVGSSQSKESDDRKEEKIDYILRKIAPEDAEKFITGLNKKFPKE